MLFQFRSNFSLHLFFFYCSSHQQSRSLNFVHLIYIPFSALLITPHNVFAISSTLPLVWEFCIPHTCFSCSAVKYIYIYPFICIILISLIVFDKRYLNYYLLLLLYFLIIITAAFVYQVQIFHSKFQNFYFHKNLPTSFLLCYKSCPYIFLLGKIIQFSIPRFPNTENMRQFYLFLSYSTFVQLKLPLLKTRYWNVCLLTRFCPRSSPLQNLYQTILNPQVGNSEKQRTNLYLYLTFYFNPHYFLHHCYNFPNIRINNIFNTYYQLSWASPISCYLKLNFVEALYSLISYFSSSPTFCNNQHLIFFQQI